MHKLHSSICKNCNRINAKNAGIGLQKVQFSECKIFKYKPLKMDSESTQNVDFKNKKMQVLHCDNCRFCFHLINITVIDCIYWMTAENALKLQWNDCDLVLTTVVHCTHCLATLNWKLKNAITALTWMLLLLQWNECKTYW